MASSILNSDDGVISGTSGLKSTGGDDGVTTFQQNGTERMRITSAGNVGIGTTSPEGLISFSAAESNTPKIKWQNTNATDADAAISSFDSTNGVSLYVGTNFYVNSGGSNARFDAGQAGSAIAFERDGSIDLLTNTSAGVATTRARITSAGDFQFNSGYGSVATAYGCRAWVNFNGTGTVAIRASGNVSSITDNGTGDYTVNFATAMPDANYCAGGSCGRVTFTTMLDLTTDPHSTSSFPIQTRRNDNNDPIDTDLVCISVFR